MVITTTAIGFIFLSVGIGTLGYQFLSAFKKSTDSRNKRTGFLLSSLFFTSATQNAIIGLGSLFFATNSSILYIALVLSHLFLILFALVGIYTLYHLFLPDKSPWLVSILVAMLGIAGFIRAFSDHIQPAITQQNNINFNINFQFSLITFLLLFISLSVTTYIFSQLFIRGNGRQMKALALSVAILAFLGIINVFIRLILLYDAPAGASDHLFDVITTSIGIGFIIVLMGVPLLKRFYDGSHGRKRE